MALLQRPKALDLAVWEQQQGLVKGLGPSEQEVEQREQAALGGMTGRHGMP